MGFKLSSSGGKKGPSRIALLTEAIIEVHSSQELSHFVIVGQTITEAFALQGRTVKFEFVPWKRAFKSALHGDCDRTAIWLKNLEREHDFYYSEPDIEECHVFFYLWRRPLEWHTVDDLKGKTLGGLQGFRMAMRLIMR